MDTKPEYEIPIEHVFSYMFAGKAELVVFNEKRGTSRHYIITKATNRDLFQVTCNKTVLGRCDNKTKLFYPASAANPEALAFGTVYHIILGLVPIEHAHFYHAGRCGKCHRKLTDPISLILGIGPECRKK